MARRLRIGTIQHSALAHRAAASVTVIERRLREAGGGPLMKFFNQEFYRRRVVAKASGQSFMPYRVTRLRLLSAVAGVVAQRGVISPSLIAQVFE